MITRSQRAVELWKTAVHIDGQIDERQVKEDGSCIACSAGEYEGLKNAAERAWGAYHAQVQKDELLDNEREERAGMLLVENFVRQGLWGESGISNGACNLAMPLALVVFLVVLVIAAHIPVDLMFVPGLLGF